MLNHPNLPGAYNIMKGMLHSGILELPVQAARCFVHSTTPQATAEQVRWEQGWVVESSGRTEAVQGRNCRWFRDGTEKEKILTAVGSTRFYPPFSMLNPQPSEWRAPVAFWALVSPSSLIWYLWMMKPMDAELTDSNCQPV